MKRILLLSVVVLLGLQTTGFALACQYQNIAEDEFFYVTCLSSGNCYGYHNWTFVYSDCRGDCSGAPQCTEIQHEAVHIRFIGLTPSGTCTEAEDCTTWNWTTTLYWPDNCRCD